MIRRTLPRLATPLVVSASVLAIVEGLRLALGG